MKYKIEVKYNGRYEQYLYQKKFIWWKVINWNFDTIPLPKIVWYWQEKYNIPDKRIVCLF